MRIWNGGSEVSVKYRIGRFQRTSSFRATQTKRTIRGKVEEAVEEVEEEEEKEEEREEKERRELKEKEGDWRSKRRNLAAALELEAPITEGGRQIRFTGARMGRRTGL